MRELASGVKNRGPDAGPLPFDGAQYADELHDAGAVTNPAAGYAQPQPQSWPRLSKLVRSCSLCLGVPNCPRPNSSDRHPPHVDHIIPLKGKLVSGLHVAANLQVLTETANKAKGNSFVEV